jgi:hypothetical protein
MIDLNTERMAGYGDYRIGEYVVNRLHGLNDFCKKYLTSDKILLELGCSTAVSSELFCNYAKSVTSVDIEKQKQVDLLHNRVNNFEFIHSSFGEFFKKNSVIYDVIYVDGCHDTSNVYTDIANSLKFINKDGGIIAGHDFNETTGVEAAVLQFFSKDRLEIFSDSSWAVKLSSGDLSSPLMDSKFIYAGDEDSSYSNDLVYDVAYGSRNSFKYKYGVTGTIIFNNETFGDPVPYVVKKGYVCIR